MQHIERIDVTIVKLQEEIYRYEHNLAEAGSLRAGNNQRFEFTIVAPGGQDPSDNGELSGKVAGGIKAAAHWLVP